MPRVTIVVPCYNEARRFNAGQFQQYALAEPDVTFLFVNDGSRDESGAMLDALGSTRPGQFAVIHLDRNQGKAEAVRQGMLAALSGEAPIVGYWDADLATPLAEIATFRRVFDDHSQVHAVLGSRVRLLGRSIERKPLRHYLGRLFATAASCVLNLPVYDTQCGAKLFRAGPALRAALATPFHSRWVFDVELLARLQSAWRSTGETRSAFYELPLAEWRDVRGSKLRLIDFARAPWELARLAIRQGRERNIINPSAIAVGSTSGPLVAPAQRHSGRSPQDAVHLAERDAYKPARSGVTLIELLVVIAIIGILAAIILPAVQMAREAARRVDCTSRIRQLGLAVHSHHDAHGMLPVNVSPWPEGPRPSGERTGKGWILHVFAQLEQGNLLDQFEQSAGGDFFSGLGLRNPACRSLMQTRLPMLRCPSDAHAFSTNEYQWEGVEVAVTSYKGVIGDSRMGGSLSSFPGTEPDCHSAGGCNGLFWRGTYQEPVRLADVLDGTSNTFMLGEDVPAHNNHSTAFYANGDYASCHAPLNYFPRPPRPRDWWDVMGFRSRHPGGANFCLADGSVRYVAQTIDQPTYRGLSTRAGGENAALP